MRLAALDAFASVMPALVVPHLVGLLEDPRLLDRPHEEQVRLFRRLTAAAS